MEFEDDRTEEQKKTHTLAIVATDSFMSGWGKADGGVSYAGWAFKDGDEYKVDRWVRNRSEMKRVRTVVLDGYKPTGAGHCHIYVVDENHRALQY